MKMLKNILIPPRMILLFLLLLSSSKAVFSADLKHGFQPEPEIQQEELNSPVWEQVSGTLDLVLPLQKNLQVIHGTFIYGNRPEAHFALYTSTSLGYIKRSRFIFPGLGIKQVIFPFHVFL